MLKKILNYKILTIFIIIISFYYSNTFAKDLRIKINSGQVEPLPVAIADFTGIEGQPSEIGRQISEVISII